MAQTDMAISAGHAEISEAEWRDFYELLKPRVMQLVVFTALVGLLIAPGAIDPVLGAISILCIAVGAGAAGALNMWYDADIDAVMTRTAKRPVPAGKITAQDALIYGVILSILSVATLGLVANWVAAAWLAFTISFYVFYTIWLKRSTPQNIVIGGAAGAFPPIIGWAVVTGSVSIEPLILFLVIFLWTPPHFWALALVKHGDYGRAGIPMMPNVAGARSTCNQILVYSVLLAAIGVAPWFAGFAGLTYLAGASLLGLAFVFYAFRLWRTPEQDAERFNKAAIGLFLYSIWHLFALFALLLAETLVLRFMGIA